MKQYNKHKFCSFFLLTLILSAVQCSASDQDFIKKPNVSGRFYSADKNKLSQQIDQFFKDAKVEPLAQRVEMIISPHAGYFYSGQTAAYGYKAASKHSYKTVVILAPSHYYPFQGVSIWPRGAFETPLGQVSVDEQFSKALLSKNKSFHNIPEVFAKEHSLEVQIPFLQKTFNNFKIVPVIFGQPDYNICKALAQALSEIIGKRKDVLVVVSTDMSHYRPESVTDQMDEVALKEIKSLNPEELWEQCRLKTTELCGYAAVTTGLLYARIAGLNQVKVLEHATSGRATGDYRSVVGYSSVVFYRKEKPTKNVRKTMDKKKDSKSSEGHVLPITLKQKKRLIDIARHAINDYVQFAQILNIEENDPRLLAEEGAFVTINENGQLRGCIGNIIGRGPLYKTVRDMAIAAATQDPRFPPLSKDELNNIEIEISVLSKPWRMKSVKELQPGIHGAIVKRGFHQGVFLPQVATEFNWNREQFLSNLCAHKAGLPPDSWKDPGTTVELFTANVFSQKDVDNDKQ